MPAFCVINNEPVLDATIEMPRRGPWHYIARLGTATVPSGSVTFAAANGLTLTGTVRRAAVDARGSVVARVVGGADGLRTAVSGHYRNGFARDVLGAICRASGETQATDIPDDVLAVQFDLYTLSGTCSAALDALAAACAKSLGSAVRWRLQPSGALWLGTESWEAATLQTTDSIADHYPGLGLYVLNVETPTVIPGVALANMGNVEEVHHFIRHDEIRSWVTVAA